MDASDQPRFELMEENIKTESAAASPRIHITESSPAPFKSSSTPIPSTEAPDGTSLTAPLATTSKKKGTASMIKKAPKRPKNGDSKKTKRAKTAASGRTSESGSGDEESDHGPYCLCRGPDDHRWMIFCEHCEDWFHGECIDLSKEFGENLIERFICPNCSDDNLFTIYKRTCSLDKCRKPSRLSQDDPSAFCSSDHAQLWWERIIAKLPKVRGKAGFSDQMTQEELMALLNSGLGGIDEDGIWRLSKAPFNQPLPSVEPSDSDDPNTDIFSEEEKEYLNDSSNARATLADETLLCHKMLSVIEMVQDRRRAAINAKQFSDDMCGYDHRLDTICARDAFSAFLNSSEGEAIFKDSKIGDPLGEDDSVRGMCERKRCKVHAGWHKMLPLGINHQIRELGSQAAEVEEDERIVREAAGERWRRKKAENNWVEVVEA